MLTFLPCCLPPAEMEAQSQQGFQDPLSAALEESERASALSLDNPAVVEAPDPRDSPTPSTNQQAADGSEDAEKAVGQNRNDGTDSSSTLSPEVPHVQSNSSQYSSSAVNPTFTRFSFISFC